MRRMYTILSFSFVVFLAVLCADFLLTGLFVGLPEGQSGWLVIWSVTVAIICFLTVILSVFQADCRLLLSEIMPLVQGFLRFQLQASLHPLHSSLPVSLPQPLRG